MADLEDDEEDLEIPEVKQEDDMETEDVKPTKLELEQIPTGKCQNFTLLYSPNPFLAHIIFSLR